MKISPEWEQKLDALPQGIFFTPLVLAFVVLSLFLSLLYHQIDLAVFTLIVMVMAMGLKVWSSFSPRALKYRVCIDKQKIFPGEKIDFRVIIENNKLLPVLVKIRLSLPQSLVSENRDLLIKEDCGALWHQKITFHRELWPAKRGLFKTGSPRLITGDFFGFFPRPTPEKQEVDILVFPRLVPVKPFPILNQIMFGKKAYTSPIHDPLYILGTRDYKSFSSARNIHWKATARHNRLQEKIFEVTEQEKIFIVFEVDGFLNNSDEKAFERAIEVIASLAFEMDANHYAMGFLTNCAMHDRGPHFLEPARRPGHLPALFEMLAKIDFGLTCPMDDFLKSAPYPFAGSICLYFSYEQVGTSFSLTQAKVPLANIISHPRHVDLKTDKRANAPGRFCFLEDICGAG